MALEKVALQFYHHQKQTATKRRFSPLPCSTLVDATKTGKALERKGATKIGQPTPWDALSPWESQSWSGFAWATVFPGWAGRQLSWRPEFARMGAEESRDVTASVEAASPVLLKTTTAYQNQTARGVMPC